MFHSKRIDVVRYRDLAQQYLSDDVGQLDMFGEDRGSIDRGAKSYREFAAQNRPEGWNLWLTFAISNAAPEPAAPTKPIYRK